MRKLTIVPATIALLVLITGCNKKTLDVELKSNRVEAGSVTSACQLVKSVDGSEVSEVSLSNNTLLAGTQTVSCHDGGLENLGETILVFESNKIRTEKVVTVVDTVAPVIHLDQNEIGVEVNNEFFNLKELVKVTDTFDKNVSVSIDGFFDINTPGTYDVQLIAKDSSNNIATKDISIHVKEKEKEIVTIVEEKQVYINGNSNSSSENSKKEPGKKLPSRGPKPSNKEYLFSAGYNMESAPSACQVDLNNAYNSGWGGTCKKKIEDGLIKGMQLVIFD
ncbi:hypothetical protein PT154_07205 [Erysipelothrix rhusiopathiae]|nr:hypothetical protein [Erysipelothrix rhusiopathiae]MDE8270666.1 hypothetical protein [Erysipelothrix rhusiopathiae]MDE8279091.1 hypothetical protein [Erysipelothrix rhusiopathiae]MDE8328245.1 hypothetical protein [Erysipelothrix rhusiopathiae]